MERMFILSWLLLQYLVTVDASDKYTFYTSSKSYFDAQSHCLNHGQRLVKIFSQSVFQEILDLASGKSSEFWIGLTLDDTRPPKRKSYKYEDGESANFYKWASNEPDDQLTDQCVRLRFEGGTGVYRTKQCSKQYDFVCELPDLTTVDTTVIDTTTLETTLDDTTIEPTTLDTTTLEITTLETTTLQTTAFGQTTLETTIETTTLETTTDDNELSSTSTYEFPSTTLEFLRYLSTSQIQTTCTCESLWNTSGTNITYDELQTRLQKIRSALIVNKTDLSATRRKLISAEDDRQSSTIIGYVGASFISSVVFFLVIGDILHVFKWLFCRCK